MIQQQIAILASDRCHPSAQNHPCHFARFIFKDFWKFIATETKPRYHAVGCSTTSHWNPQSLQQGLTLAPQPEP
jgi:hypothetical protein